MLYPKNTLYDSDYVNIIYTRTVGDECIIYAIYAWLIYKPPGPPAEFWDDWKASILLQCLQRVRGEVCTKRESNLIT